MEHSQEENEDKLGGKQETTTTYTYTQEWVSSPINSANFKDPAYQNKNYTWTQVENQELWAENVKFGAYVLNESLIQSIHSTEAVELNINEQVLEAMDKSIGDTYVRIKGNAVASQSDIALANIEEDVDSVETVLPDSIAQNNKVDLIYVHQAGNILYYGRFMNTPEVGDVRITFEKIVPAKVTVIAQVDGNTFKAFKTSNGKRYQTLVMGKKSAEDIFDAEHEANSMWTWLLRILGIILVIAGFKSLFGFVETILKVVPFLSSIFAFGAGIISTILGLVWSLIVIAVAWIFYRPILGIIILVIAGFLVWVFAFNGKKKLAELTNRGKA